MNILLLENYTRNSLRRQRVLRDRLAPLDHFDDFELKKLFRFNRDNLIKLIDSMEAQLRNYTNLSKSLSAGVGPATGISIFSGHGHSLAGTGVGTGTGTGIFAHLENSLKIQKYDVLVMSQTRHENLRSLPNEVYRHFTPLLNRL